MGMELELPSIQLKVMSCTDLKAFNFFHKLSAYVVVSILRVDPQNNKKQMLLQQRQKTGMDRDGEWNQLMYFDLKPISLLDSTTHVYLKFQLRCKGIIYGNKTIGEVYVPLEDLIQDSSSGGGGHGDVRFVSYQVRTTNGKPNGVLNFSYKVIHNVIKTGTVNDPHPPPPAEMERARYPSQEDYKTRTGSHPPAFETEKIRYPSLEDIYPSPNDVDVDVYCPSPTVSFYNYQKPEFYCTPPPVAAGTLYYSPPPGPYNYVLESRGYC